MTLRERNREYYRKWLSKPGNREKANARSLAWQQKMREERRPKLNDYQNSRRRNNLNSRIAHNFRERIRAALSGRCKSSTSLMLMGCSIDALRNRLQTQFLPGMTWENYGLWHIDHIKPCALFDLSVPEEQKKCFNFSNLQPLWKSDNLRKGVLYTKPETCNF